VRHIFLGTVIAALLTSPAPAQKIVGGPYVVNATTGNATVAWVVEDSQITLHEPDQQSRTSPALRVEKTTLTGLKPGSRYDYDAAGTHGYFKTPPLGAGPYNFIVYGDTRSRHDVHRRVMTELLKHGIPDFVLQTGDMVVDGDDSSLWPVFFDIEKDLLRQTVFFPSLGNHERNTDYFSNFFLKDNPYYSFNWGNGHFIVLNSDIGNVAAGQRGKDTYWAAQTQWLEDDLERNQKAEYRFVIAHHPPFTAVASRQGQNPHMTALTPLFEKYHVTAALFGHDHNYQHYLKNGIHYVVTGGGGAPLYDVSKPAPGITQKVVSIENFVKVSADSAGLHFEAIDINGRTIEVRYPVKVTDLSARLPG
jgi:3',5'-cyclic AMP phosphodiesterase CpdA